MPSYLFIIYYCLYLFAPAAPCSYSLPVSAAPAVPFVIPRLLPFSAASWLLVPVCPDSEIFSLISLFTAVGSCSFIFAGVIGSFSLYSVNGSSFLPISVPGPPSSNRLDCWLVLALVVEVGDETPSLALLVVLSAAPFTLFLAPVNFCLNFSATLPMPLHYYPPY